MSAESARLMLRGTDEIQNQIRAIRALYHGMQHGATPESVGLDWSVIDQHFHMLSDEEREMLGCFSQMPFDEVSNDTDQTEAENLVALLQLAFSRVRGSRRRRSRRSRCGGQQARDRRDQ